MAAGSILPTRGTSRSAHAAGSDVIRIRLVGCGGRGTGAALQALSAVRHTEMVAVADAFEDRIETCLRSLACRDDVAQPITLGADHRLAGFDGYPPEKKEKYSHQLEHDAFFAALRDSRIMA